MSDTPRASNLVKQFTKPDLPGSNAALALYELAEKLERELNEAVGLLNHAIEAEEPGWIGDSEPSWMRGARAFLAKQEKP